MYKLDKRSMIVKRVVICIMILGLCVAGNVSPTLVYASTENPDEAAAIYGFEIDLDRYHQSVWYNTVTTNVKADGNVIGVCTTKMGMTRAKQKTSSGDYMDHMLVRCTMKGRNPVTNYAGYSEHLTIQSTLPTDTELMGYSPVQLANSISYEVGGSVGTDKIVGVSGSVTIEEKALEINSYSDTDARLFKACYDYQHGILLTWKLNKYSYNESKQLANWVIGTKDSSYGMKLIVKAKFERYDAVPGFWATSFLEYYTMNQTITFKSVY